MKVNNNIDNANRFITPAGNRFENIYTPQVDKSGNVSLKVTGKKDIKQEINSYKEQTDMAYILRMMSAGTYPEREGAMYGDFTKAPSTMAEALQIMLNAENAFYQLDLETRNKFDNDFQKWMVIASSDPKQFENLMGFDKPEEIVVEKESVTE